MEDWPKEGDAIGAGWSFGPCRCEANVPAFGIQYYTTKTISGQYIKWPAITLVQSTSVRYEVSAPSSKRLSFEVTADTQEIMSDAADEETIVIALQSRRRGSADRSDAWRPFGIPAGGIFPTDRGLQSVSYLVPSPAPSCWPRARAVEITFRDEPRSWARPVMPEECCQDRRSPSARRRGDRREGRRLFALPQWRQRPGSDPHRDGLHDWQGRQS